MIPIFLFNFNFRYPCDFRFFRFFTIFSETTYVSALLYTAESYTSADSGVTWAARENNRYWRWSITSSADGTKLAALVDNGKIYTSINSGVTWTARDTNR